MGFSCGAQLELAAPGRAERCVLAAGRSQAAQSHTLIQELRVLRLKIVHKKKKDSACVFHSMTRRRR